MRKYEDLKYIHENTEPPRSHYIPYDSLEKALGHDKSVSKHYELLNGEWDFCFNKRDIDYSPETAKWDKIKVPSCWQALGYENPNYANARYPIPVDAPYVPDDNPMGVYRRVYTADENIESTENYLVFEGVCSWFEVYLNGEYVGCSSVSHCCSEFKINLLKGDNLIEVRVWKWSAQTYLEDQDMFRYNGIFRDVYILKRNKGHVKDIEIGFDSKKIYCDLKYRVFDADNNETDLENPILWNAENPYLYTVIVEEAGEYIPIRIGLRDQGISEKGEFLVNGVSIKLKGVNHHDSHHLNGYVMTYDELKKDLILMKKLNINTIRMSHYPPSPEFLELCDEMGFYVIDEADMETHGYIYRNSDELRHTQTTWPCGMPEWRDAFLDRAERMFERDKNHTCIIMWSFGNESSYEENFEEMGKYLLERDSKVGIRRLRHYEQACNAPEHMKVNGQDPYTVDVVSRMYYSVEMMLEYLKNGDKRPFFLCEYCHSMGNGPGDMYDYWEGFEKHPQMIGGCIWEWADHVYLDDGKPLYGGDWNELAHDTHFCCDGMLFYDRSLKAGSYEIKKIYQPMSSELDGNRLKINNKYDFTSFSGFNFKLVIENDGTQIFSKEFVLNTPPHSSDIIEFDIPQENTTLGMYVTLYMYDKDGYERAFSQHLLKDTSVALPVEQGAQIVTDGEYAYIQTDDGELVFNIHYGRLEKIGNLIKTPFELSIWKAPLDNDRQMKYRFYEENYNKLLNKVYNVDIEGNQITVCAGLSTVSKEVFLRYTISYTFMKSGRIDVKLTGDFNDRRMYLPRLGFEFETDYKEFKYYGYGPHESYIDMHHASQMGMYESNAEKEFVPYVRPQEHGNHYNTKLLELGDYIFISQKGFEFNVSEYKSFELEAKKHCFELEKNDNTIVRIDYKVSGIGSGSVGPQLVEKYQMNDKKVSLEFSVIKK